MIIIFYFTSERLFTVSEREIQGYLTILFIIVSFVLSPSFTAEQQNDNKQKIMDAELAEGEYHNDFSRVGKTEDYVNVKPVDLSGDAIIHAKESLDEDLKRIGLESSDSEDKDENKA